MILVEYVDHMGNDLTVVNAARVSMNKHKNQFDDKDVRLVKYLAKHRHWTPFANCAITVRETVPIFIARQRFKHMVGFNYNEVSRRYVDTPPEFYYPDYWRKRPEDNIKQGSGGFHEDSVWWMDIYSKYIKEAEDMYQGMIDEGIAPEQARMVLPQSMLTSYYVTGSLEAFARAYRQRIDTSTAQIEIAKLAEQWDSIIKPLFPYSWDALTKSE